MEQTNFVYPNFNSGQLLTSELLNNSVGYLVPILLEWVSLKASHIAIKKVL